MPAPLPPPKRVLLIRLSAFGDVVIATGLLQGLKRAYPEAEVDWLVQPEFAELLRTQASISKVMVWDRKHWKQLLHSGRWLKLWRTIRSFSATLRERDYDWVIDAQGLFKSRALAKLAGGSWRVGYDSKEPGKIWMNQLVQRYPEAHTQRRFIGDEHAPMLEALTGEREVIPHLELTAAADGMSYLIAAPFTTRPQKHWPEDHWINLLKSLTELGHRTLLLGGPADSAAAERVASKVESPLLENWVGKTSFVAAGRLIAGAKAMIGVDTGLTHLGFALQRPTVAIFGSTRPYSEARNLESSVLSKTLACSPCGRHPTCAGRWDCMRQLSAAEAGYAVNTALTATERHAS